MLNKNTEISFYHFRKIWESKARIPVIHCGAHTGEEAPTYFDLNMFPIYWVEAQPDIIDELRKNVYKYPLNEVVEAALWSESGQLFDMGISDDIYSSSLMTPMDIVKVSKGAKAAQKVSVSSKTLDELNLRFYDEGLLVLDVQGAESQVLEGSTQVLANSKWVYCEVTKIEMYRGSARWSEIDIQLKSKGFKLVDWQYDQEQDWGNALYRKGRGRFLDPIRRLRRRNLHDNSWNAVEALQQKW